MEFKHWGSFESIEFWKNSEKKNFIHVKRKKKYVKNINKLFIFLFS